MPLHLIKLCVGVETPEQLEAIHARRAAAGGGAPHHVTRQTPRRAEEIVDGGSLYWVMKRVVMARQRVTALEAVERDGRDACRIVLDPAIVRTEPMLKRPFQGWRYLKDSEAPRDLPDAAAGGEDLPPELRRRLMELGAW